MQIHRFYCDSIIQPQTVLTGTEAHHVNSVLRLKCGDVVELFDGHGALAKAAVAELSSKQVTLQIKEVITHPAPKRPAIIIAASVAKGERFDWLVGKCTEFGVDRIIPIIFERTVKQPKNPKIVDRWRNITVAAAKQCKRLFLPVIDSPVQFTEAVTKLAADYPGARILVGSLADNAKPLIKMEFDDRNVIAFIGPEGGFTETENELLTNAGAQPVQLTDTVLRVETAAIAFAAVLAAARDTLPQEKAS